MLINVFYTKKDIVSDEKKFDLMTNKKINENKSWKKLETKNKPLEHVSPRYDVLEQSQVGVEGMTVSKLGLHVPPFRHMRDSQPVEQPLDTAE